MISTNTCLGRLLRITCAALVLSVCVTAAAAAPRKQAKKSSSKPHTATTHSKTTAHSSGKSSRKTSSKKTSASKPSHPVAMDSERATAIQSALIRAGYLSGEPSGHWDADSQAAMQKMQSANGWQTKIVPDSRAIIKLGLGPQPVVPQ